MSLLLYCLGDLLLYPMYVCILKTFHVHFSTTCLTSWYMFMYICMLLRAVQLFFIESSYLPLVPPVVYTHLYCIYIYVYVWTITQDGDSASRLLEYLMQKCHHDNRSIFRNNLEIINTMLELWREKLQAPTKYILPDCSQHVASICGVRYCYRQSQDVPDKLACRAHTASALVPITLA